MTESIDSSLSGILEEVPNVSVQHYKFTINGPVTMLPR
jgi:hypothetical protein